jgi:hypothetical protein
MENDEFKRRQWRSRLMLLLIVAMFLGSFGIAAILRFSGWEPASHRNFGEMLNPPLDFSAQNFIRADGSPYPWQPELNRWRLVVVSDQPCLSACIEMMDTLKRVWTSQGRHSERIDVLWFGPLPAQPPSFPGFVPMRFDNGLADALAQNGSVGGYPVTIIDSGGFAVLRYPAGFNPNELRKDLAKLVK